MAHVTLEHAFSVSLVTERGCRTSDRQQEEEAAELAGELLLPFDAARSLARRGVVNEDAALVFGVSPEVARWRLDSTGARKIAARTAAVYRR